MLNKIFFLLILACQFLTACKDEPVSEDISAYKTIAVKALTVRLIRSILPR